jgi:hypothetical protein
MQYTSPPAKFNIPFANSGGKNTIPQASQIGVVDGAASLTDGFPPLTRTRIDQGGIPPSGLDMNGILFGVTQSIRWTQAGGGNTFDSTFASAIGGYPKGSRVLRSDGRGYWLNTADSNTTDPEGSASASTSAGWVPDMMRGVVDITMSSTSYTLNPDQYGNPTISVSGTLTASVNLIFPAIVGEWTVINKTTGNYLLSVKTASGAGVVVKKNEPTKIYCDGTNIVQVTGTATATNDSALADNSSSPASTSWSSLKFLAKTGGTLTGPLFGVGASFSSDVAAENLSATVAVHAPSPAASETGTKCVNLNYIRNPAHLMRFDTSDVSSVTWGSTPELSQCKVNGAVFLVLFGAGETAMSSVVSYRSSVAQKGSVSVDDSVQKMYYAFCDESGFTGFSINPNLTGATAVAIQAIIRIH